MQRRLLPALLCLFLSICTRLEAVEIVITPGLDLPTAVRQAREMRRLHQVAEADTLFITFSDGVYPITETLHIRPEDSGTPKGPTVLRALNPGKAIIDGGLALTGWRRPSQQELLGIPQDVQHRIWVCPTPTVNGRRIEVHQLYAQNKRLPEASLVPSNQMLPLTSFSTGTREISVQASYLPTAYLKHFEGSEMRVHQRWAIAYLRIKSVRVDAGTAHFQFLEPESRREFEHPWPQPVINEDLGNGEIVSSSFNLLGSLAFLDQPDEWVQCASNGLIYYFTPDEGGAAPREPIIIPVLNHLLQVAGTIERPVHHLSFEGLTFQHTRWNQPNEEGLVTLQAGFPIQEAYKLVVPGLPEKASLENQAWIGRPQSAVSLKGACHVDFKGCNFQQIGATALDYEENTSHCQVTNNQFSDIGGTAILVGHFPAGGFETHVPFTPQKKEGLCHDMLISNNTIRVVGADDWGACAINAGYVYNTTIQQNQVQDCPWSGICLGWGWTPLQSGMENNHILQNTVIRFGMQMHDCGAIYTLSNQPHSSIIGNTLGQLGTAPYATNHRAFYIYLDEATDGFTIRNNQMPEPLIGTNQPGPNLISDIPLP